MGFFLARIDDIARFSPLLSAFIHSHGTMLIFKKMIKDAYGGQPPILIPDQITDTWKKQAKYSYRKKPAE